MRVNKGKLCAFLYITIVLINIHGSAFAKLPLKPLLINNENKNSDVKSNTGTPIGVDDTFILAQGCTIELLQDNVLDNDDWNGADSIKIAYAFAPSIGVFSIGPNGKFIFKCDSIFTGETSFSYRVCNANIPELYSDATVTILIEPDSDCDKIADIVDLDDDNDGILDIHEGDEDADFDLDGIPNRLDIDSDNDGITDFTEWQIDTSSIKLLLTDMNNDGWDDAFDASTGGEYYEQVDTDLDGSPDFLDTDSDDDGVEDYIEACDLDNDGIPDFVFLNTDADQDGLDDVFDVVEGWESGFNSSGSSAPLPDTNDNNIRDWRDQTNHSIKGEENLASTLNELSIFPNPAKEFCSIQIPIENAEATEYQIYVYDLKGKLLIHETMSETTFQINVEELNAGTFVFIVESGNDRFFGKFVKQD
jgi:hypothetical protein